MSTVIGWFSGGVTSAVAIKLSLRWHPMQLYFFETNQHHPDNMRFLSDCEKWYGQKIHILRNKKAGSVREVIEKGHINSPYGAECTRTLKKDMRVRLETMVDYYGQVFGFENEKNQIKRAQRFSEQYPESKAIFPLIVEFKTKQDCFKILLDAGIELPMMYRLGFNNANCMGCVKGGIGYWLKTKEVFPELFKATAELERKLERTCINGRYLDSLMPGQGRHKSIDLPECGVTCEVEFT